MTAAKTGPSPRDVEVAASVAKRLEECIFTGSGKDVYEGIVMRVSEALASERARLLDEVARALPERECDHNDKEWETLSDWQRGWCRGRNECRDAVAAMLKERA